MSGTQLEARVGGQAALVDPEEVMPLDSAEYEYAPGLVGQLVTAAGDTIVYTPPAGKAWKMHWASAVPVLRDMENPPVITIKLVDSVGTLIKNLYVTAALSKRKLVTAPVDAQLIVNLDIAGRVPVTFDIQEL